MVHSLPERTDSQPPSPAPLGEVWDLEVELGEKVFEVYLQSLDPVTNNASSNPIKSSSPLPSDMSGSSPCPGSLKSSFVCVSLKPNFAFEEQFLYLCHFVFIRTLWNGNYDLHPIDEETDEVISPRQKTRGSAETLKSDSRYTVFLRHGNCQCQRKLHPSLLLNKCY